MKILYVEDHPAQREILQNQLEMSGYEVALANAGDEGVQKAHEWQPDIILMDLRMPRMSGFEAIKALKSDPTVSTIPIIVISAWASRKNREEALQAGAEAVLAKPVKLEQLINRIERLRK